MEIQWRCVPGYDYLMVSETGDFKTKDRVVRYSAGNQVRERYFKGTILHPTLNSNGYRVISSSRTEGRKQLYCHILVAMAFPDICGKWFDGCVVDHIDTVRDNDNANNLRVCTTSQNIANPLSMAKRKRDKAGRFAYVCL